jgi:hypothetical protein
MIAKAIPKAYAYRDQLGRDDKNVTELYTHPIWNRDPNCVSVPLRKNAAVEAIPGYTVARLLRAINLGHKD